MLIVNRLREGLNEAWESVADGWQRLSRNAAGALTRFTHRDEPRAAAERGTGPTEDARSPAGPVSAWGVLPGEVFEDDDQIVVRLEAPGMDKGDFDLQVLDDSLVVSGEKRLQRERTVGRYQISECAYGQFKRAIPLPDKVDAGGAKARYRSGVLRVELPKAEPGRRKRISVDVG